jgi:hypothetical protein
MLKLWLDECLASLSDDDDDESDQKHIEVDCTPTTDAAIDAQIDAVLNTTPESIARMKKLVVVDDDGDSDEFDAEFDAMLERVLYPTIQAIATMLCATNDAEHVARFSLSFFSQLQTKKKDWCS